MCPVELRPQRGRNWEGAVQLAITFNPPLPNSDTPKFNRRARCILRESVGSAKTSPQGSGNFNGLFRSLCGT